MSFPKKGKSFPKKGKSFPKRDGDGGSDFNLDDRAFHDIADQGVPRREHHHTERHHAQE